MDKAVVLILMMATALAAFSVGVESQQRVCYSGPPPVPDPDHPGDWKKQVLAEIRKRCPGPRQVKQPPQSDESATPKTASLG